MIRALKRVYYLACHLFSPYVRLFKHRIANALFTHKGYPLIYCLGDSHNEVFDYIRNCKLLPQVNMRCVTVQGATIFGLANPNSRSNALTIFRRELSHAPPGSIVTLLLGEIDCGFLIWLRSQKKGTSIDTEFNESLSRYKNFLVWVSSLQLSKICVVSVPPQTIQDNQKTGEIANPRQSVKVAYRDRSELTARYNKQLQKITAELGNHFLDMDPLLLDSESGKIKSCFLNQGRLDHHMNYKTAAPLYAEALRSYLLT